MSYFMQGAQLGYLDYLAKSSDQLPMVIADQTQAIISSFEALARHQVKIQSSLREGLEILDFKLSGIAELNSRFDWGFSNILSKLGGMNDSLEALVKTSKTPVQTFAFNHFEIARDAFRKGLYREALEELDKAINGDNTSSGYKLEWRFHHLRGVIRLGFSDCDITLVDLTEAEGAFLLAARYAKADNPEDAARSFLSAGWAAYCQGKMETALEHTKQALNIENNMGEALFQIAKILVAIDQEEEAFSFLLKAIELDKFYAVKAAGDGDFKKHEDSFNAFINRLRDEKYHKMFLKVDAGLEEVKDWSENTDDAKKDENLLSLKKFISEGSSWPLIDLIDYGETVERLVSEIRKSANDFVLQYVARVKDVSHQVRALQENPMSTIGLDAELKDLDIFVSNNGKTPWSISEMQTLIPEYLSEIKSEYEKYMKEKKASEERARERERYERHKKLFEDTKNDIQSAFNSQAVIEWINASHIQTTAYKALLSFNNSNDYLSWPIWKIQEMHKYLEEVKKMANQYYREKYEIRGSGSNTNSISGIKIDTSSGSTCFVASATYGDAYHPDVILLKSFRDEFLIHTALGRIFIDAYWIIGPRLSILVQKSLILKSFSRWIISKLIKLINRYWEQ